MAAKARARDKARRARARAAAAVEGTDGASDDDTRRTSKPAAATKTDTRRTQRKDRAASGRATPPRSGRHTPPVPKKVKTSPRWMGFAIVGSFVVGALVVILDYVGLLPGGVNNIWLLAAIAAIFVGLLLATRYH